MVSHGYHGGMNQDHDSGYRRLFSHPEMVRDLLLDYAPGNCWAKVDFSTLEPVSGSFVTACADKAHVIRKRVVAPI